MFSPADFQLEQLGRPLGPRGDEAQTGQDDSRSCQERRPLGLTPLRDQVHQEEGADRQRENHLGEEPLETRADQLARQVVLFTRRHQDSLLLAQGHVVANRLESRIHVIRQETRVDAQDDAEDGQRREDEHLTTIEILEGLVLLLLRLTEVDPLHRPQDVSRGQHHAGQRQVDDPARQSEDRAVVGEEGLRAERTGEGRELGDEPVESRETQTGEEADDREPGVVRHLQSDAAEVVQVAMVGAVVDDAHAGGTSSPS